MRGLARRALVLDDVARLQDLMPRLRVRMNDRRRQPFEPLQCRAIGRRTSRPRAIRRNQGGEHTRRCRGPLAPAQATGVCRAVGVAAKRPVQEFHRDSKHQSASSGHEARMARRRLSLGVSITGAWPQPSRGTPTGLGMCERALQECGGALVATERAYRILTTSEPRGEGLPGPQLGTRTQRKSSTERQLVGV